jgi:hypothetical protein
MSSPDYIAGAKAKAAHFGQGSAWPAGARRSEEISKNQRLRFGVCENDSPGTKKELDFWNKHGTLAQLSLPDAVSNPPLLARAQWPMRGR